MNGTLIWQLALRYLRGKRSGNAIPILSRISMTAIAVASGALIVVFSVFNGFEFLVKDMYKAFYPDIKISAAKGKFFSFDSSQFAKVQHLAGIQNASLIIEDNALADGEQIVGNSQQHIITLKGIDANYLKVNDIKPYIVQGADSVSAHQMPTVMGIQIANQLGLDVTKVFSRVVLYYPNTDVVNPALDPLSALRSATVKPNGTFRIQDDFDSKYILAPLPLVQELFGEDGKYSSIEIKIASDTKPDAIKKQLQNLLGNNYHIETRFEQNRTLYMAMGMEKWFCYAILLLVLLIASFNMIGGLSLLVLEKQKDMAILRAMGAEPATIRRIFILEGMLWAFTGGAIGILLGTLLCLGQEHFGWIKLEGAFIIDAYPVQMQVMDFILVIITIIAVGLLAAWYPAARATKAEMPSLRSN